MKLANTASKARGRFGFLLQRLLVIIVFSRVISLEKFLSLVTLWCMIIRVLIELRPSTAMCPILGNALGWRPVVFGELSLGPGCGVGLPRASVDTTSADQKIGLWRGDFGCLGRRLSCQDCMESLLLWLKSSPGDYALNLRAYSWLIRELSCESLPLLRVGLCS